MSSRGLKYSIGVSVIPVECLEARLVDVDEEKKKKKKSKQQISRSGWSRPRLPRTVAPSRSTRQWPPFSGWAAELQGLPVKSALIRASNQRQPEPLDMDMHLPFLDFQVSRLQLLPGT
jgi:hypothetical protein